MYLKQAIFLGYTVLQLYSVVKICATFGDCTYTGIRRETPDKTTINLVRMASNIRKFVAKTRVEGKCCPNMRTNMRYYLFMRLQCGFLFPNYNQPDATTRRLGRINVINVVGSIYINNYLSTDYKQSILWNVA